MKWTTEQRTQAHELHRQGRTNREIANAMGVPIGGLYHVLRGKPVPVAKSHGKAAVVVGFDGMGCGYVAAECDTLRGAQLSAAHLRRAGRKSEVYERVTG